MNKEASYLKSHLAILHQTKTQFTCCVMVARPISLHEQNLAIFGQNSKHTLPDELWALFSPASLTDGLLKS